MGTVGVGIIGCGMIAHFHARAIAELRGVKLRAVQTSKLSNGQSVVSAYGSSADIHHDLDEMLARTDIELVCICTPSGAHLEPGIKAARAKKACPGGKAARDHPQAVRCPDCRVQTSEGAAWDDLSLAIQ